MGESKTNFNNLLESKKEALDDIKFEIIEIKKKRQIILKQLNTIEKDFKSKNYSSNFQYKYGINKNEWNKNKDKMKNAEEKCTSLGFTAGTERHGDCVMKLLDY